MNMRDVQKARKLAQKINIFLGNDICRCKTYGVARANQIPTAIDSSIGRVAKEMKPASSIAVMERASDTRCMDEQHIEQ